MENVNLYFRIPWAEVYLEPYKTSLMELLVKIANDH